METSGFFYAIKKRGKMMFNNVKKRIDETVNDKDIETIIGKNTHITGGISGTGNLRVDGCIEGGISITGNVVIGTEGKVIGDIKANSLNVSGNITGNLDIKDCLCIYATGQLLGDVKVSSLNIEEGGIFKGRSEMSVKKDETVVKLSKIQAAK